MSLSALRTGVGMVRDERMASRRDSFDNLGLPQVDNPDKVFAQILRDDYANYINNFRDYERQLIGRLDDTSLVDRTRENAKMQTEKAAAIQARNLERYGGAGLSAAQLQEQQRSAQRAGQLGLAGGVNQARVRQREMNNALLQEIIGIGQGINAGALQSLSTAAQGEVARRGAYKNAKAGYASQMTNMGASILAAFLI